MILDLRGFKNFASLLIYGKVYCKRLTMEDKNNQLRMSWKAIVALYGFAFFIIVISSILSPTNLAGPGINMLVIFITIVANVSLFFRSGFKLIGGDKSYKQPVLVHGIVFLFWFGAIIVTIVSAAISNHQ
jgi:hypothetical protein